MLVQEAGLADARTIARYQPVIGLEVHVQLKTRTKIFSHSTHRFGRPPNSQTDPVVLGLPGALPVLNEQAVVLATKAAMAINCEVNGYSQFARKNYFYPDLPKGYQISQYDRPLAERGWLDIHVDGRSKRIFITRLHMEEDAGKTVHDGFSDSHRYSYVDPEPRRSPALRDRQRAGHAERRRGRSLSERTQAGRPIRRRFRLRHGKRASSGATPTSPFGSRAPRSSERAARSRT